MKFKIELSGGLELLFNKSKKMEVEIGEKEIVIVQDIINELRTKIIEKPDFFITKDNSM